MAAAAENTVTDRDLMRVADLIIPDTILKITIECLDLDKHEVDQMRANAASKQAPIYEFHMDCLVRWKHKKGQQATREKLHTRLLEAANKGLIDRGRLAFLLEVVGYVNKYNLSLCLSYHVE